MADLLKPFDKCRGYISSQIKRAEEEGVVPAGQNTAITLSRETGAGAVTLGDRLAEYLNQHSGGSEKIWTVFDKNLIKQVLEDHDLPARLEKFMPEDIPNVVKESVGDMLGIHPPNWELVNHTEETIYRLAKMGSCILVGRGANVITRDLQNMIHIRLVGSLEKRVIRCMDYYGITESEAQALIKKQDRGRRRYLLANYDSDIDDPTNYHWLINVDMLSSERLVKFIGDLALNWVC